MKRGERICNTLKDVRIQFADGNVTEYVYSASGQKLGVEYRVAAPNTTVTFGVEPDALTLGQTVYAGSTQYLLGGSLVVKDGLTDRYLFDGGYAKALFVSPTTYSFEFHYYNRDHLGNNREVVDSAGVVEQVTNYYPFGTPYTQSAAVMNANMQPYKFNGKELDDETGLYYYGARYYDPKLSLWFSVDPLSYYNPLGHDNHIDGKHNGGIFNQGNLNPYIYCYNNSVKYLDPNGEQVVAVHGTWSDNNTWEDKQGISRYAAIKFGNTSFNFDFKWSGGNFSSYRYDAADQLIKHIRLIRIGLEQTEPITLVGHSHGGNVCIEAINKMVLMHEFDDIKINLLTINTPVRKDHQLSYEAQKRVRHINVFDPFDPVQIMGGNLFELTPILKKESPEKPYGEFGPAKRKFKNAYNIEVNNPQNAFHDYHNSHNRVKDWEDK